MVKNVEYLLDFKDNKSMIFSRIKDRLSLDS